MLRDALPIEYEDGMSLSVNLRGWYLQMSFSPLHPLMVICLARAIPIPASVAQFLTTNEVNLHSILHRHPQPLSPRTLPGSIYPMKSEPS